jgi:hypothetical protein
VLGYLVGRIRQRDPYDRVRPPPEESVSLRKWAIPAVACRLPEAEADLEPRNAQDPDLI